MDPLSQACLGSSLAQATENNRTKQLSALIIGALSGMAPDLDFLIRSSSDPLLFLEYHRQFTHSLIFIPIGALFCTVLLYFLFKKQLTFKQVYIFSFLGYATHGLLDACTSYGTQLFWPFSNERVSWSIVSIIDPVFTIPILLLIMFSVYKKNNHYARIAFTYAILFLSVGFFQKIRALDSIVQIAKQRGHLPERIIVKPSFANRHVWKLIYEYNNNYYVDAVKLLWNKHLIPGTSVQKLDVLRDFPSLNKQSIQAKDIERFRWFSNDFLAVNPFDKSIIIDVRYSFIPNKIKMMWGIKIDNSMNHVLFKTKSRPNKKTRQEFIDMLF